MKVRKIIPSTIHQALYYNTCILQWWEDARTKGLASLKSLTVSHHCFPSTDAHFSTTPSAARLTQTMSELHNVFNARNLATVRGKCFRSYWRRTLSERGLKERKKEKSSKLIFKYKRQSLFYQSARTEILHPLPEGWATIVWNPHYKLYWFIGYSNF